MNEKSDSFIKKRGRPIGWRKVNPKHRVIMLRIDEELYLKILKISEDKKLTLSEVVRQSVEHCCG